jgi:ferritin
MQGVTGDEYFYDPRSYNTWFKDNRFEGIAKWMDVDAAIELFPHKRELLEGLFEGDSDLTTNPTGKSSG